MKHDTRTARALLAALLLPLLLPGDAAATPQEEERQVRREVVVVGAKPGHQRKPGHHRLIPGQLAHRGYLGVQLLNLTPELRQHFGASRQSGVLVSRVARDSPAEAAGVAVGDVISAVDGEPLRTSSQLVGRIGGRDEGDEVELQIWRDRSAITLRATLAQTERRQVEIGRFVWHDGDPSGPFVIDLDEEMVEEVLPFELDKIQQVITVDPETINESVRRLLKRIEEEGGAPGGLLMSGEHREQLEKRIAELEERLREMERQLRLRHRDD